MMLSWMVIVLAVLVALLASACGGLLAVIYVLRRSASPPQASERVRLPKGHIFTSSEEARRIAWARRLIARLEGVGQGLGYGIFHGGTLVRDIDIVAVPWSEDSQHRGVPFDFMSGLAAAFPGAYWESSGDTLFGHAAYILWMPGHPDHPIDLKVMRPGRRADGEDD